MSGTEALAARFLAGDPRALARSLSLVEADDPRGEALLAELRPRAGGARLIGLTGAPGVGKSTLADALIEAWRTRGARVAVVAIDPSSPFSGGALLGDRVRMTRWSGDPGVFVRSMASRGRSGGLAPRTLAALTLLDAFGFDVVLLETVGVGQAEVDVASVADTTLVVLAPGQGDDVQAAKAGIMEVADVFALTKADRPDAGRLAREVRDVLAVRDAAADPGAAGSSGAGDRSPGWSPPVVALAVGVPRQERPPALAADGGIGALVAAIEAHARHMAGRGAASRGVQRARAEVEAHAQAALRAALGAMGSEPFARVARGEDAPALAAADALRSAVEATERVAASSPSPSGAAGRGGGVGAAPGTLDP
jgi:LAO/AO transport system kinase